MKQRRVVISITVLVIAGIAALFIALNHQGRPTKDNPFVVRNLRYVPAQFRVHNGCVEAEIDMHESVAGDFKADDAFLRSMLLTLKIGDLELRGFGVVIMEKEQNPHTFQFAVTHNGQFIGLAPMEFSKSDTRRAKITYGRQTNK